MTPWKWLQAHNVELGLSLTVVLVGLLGGIGCMFWRNRSKPPENPIPPLDQALMELSDEQYRARVNVPQRKEGEPQ